MSFLQQVNEYYFRASVYLHRRADKVDITSLAQTSVDTVEEVYQFLVDFSEQFAHDMGGQLEGDPPSVEFLSEKFIEFYNDDIDVSELQFIVEAFEDRDLVLRFYLLMHD